MSATLRVLECLREVEATPNKLVLIVGKAGAGKSKILRELGDTRGFRYLDCRYLVTDELIDLVPKARQEQAAGIMDEVLRGFSVETFLLDGIELLFKPVLCLEPLAILRQLSRKYSLIVAWPGEYSNGQLIFCDWQLNNHSFDAANLSIIEL
ncbi:MAG: BREX-3 system P-loop-containing protein BrxF [Sporomusaceae bacterium]|nr:BREX-3 system P-loop-containing protein BrxF [Sporomusaceae bacterium]